MCFGRMIQDQPSRLSSASLTEAQVFISSIRPWMLASAATSILADFASSITSCNHPLLPTELQGGTPCLLLLHCFSTSFQCFFSVKCRSLSDLLIRLPKPVFELPGPSLWSSLSFILAIEKKSTEEKKKTCLPIEKTPLRLICPQKGHRTSLRVVEPLPSRRDLWPRVQEATVGLNTLRSSQRGCTNITLVWQVRLTLQTEWALDPVPMRANRRAPVACLLRLR